MNKLKNEINVNEVIFIINIELKQEIASSIINACKLYHFKYVQLNDVDKIDGHPTRNGMKQIAKQVSEGLM